MTINASNSDVITSADDGSCIVWDLKRFIRKNAFFASTMFRPALYFPDESQILTAGSDRKITYWDTVSATAIRIIDGSKDEINTMAISADGGLFVSSGEDKIVKVLVYDEGREVFQGTGHSGGIKKVTISPDQSTIISVDDVGAILVWEMPDTKPYVIDDDELAGEMK